jgi:hypothetical protein
MTKKTSKILNAHAKKRAAERYDLALNKDARREIVQKIQTNQAEFVAKQSNNRSLWRVDFQDRSLNVVYDKQRSTLCTVLPPEAREFQHPHSEHAQKEFERREGRREITAELAELWKDEEPNTGH